MDLEKRKNDIAIVVVGYNKCESILRLLESLKRADYGKDKVDLIITIDNSGSSDVENVAEKFRWDNGEKKIRTFEERQGLKKHILSCGDFLDIYDAIFVLEDDLIVSPYFYQYGKKCIEIYENDENIEGISLYSSKWNQNANFPFEPFKTTYDIYFMQLAQSWGQIWFKEKYKSFIKWYEENEEFFEKKESSRIPHNLYTWGNNSWLKYHIAYCIIKNKYFVYPYYSYTSAFVESGTHFVTNLTRYHADMVMTDFEEYKLPKYEDSAVKYDAFYENENLKRKLEEEYGVVVKIDMYGMKSVEDDDKYILSTQILPYKMIDEYGLQLRPIELNVYMNIKGEGIFLYDLEHREDIQKKKKTKQIVKKWDYFMKERFVMWNEIVPICKQKISNLFQIAKKMWR